MWAHSLCPLQVVTAASATKKPPQATESHFDWKNYKYPQSGFAIDFPKKPEYVQQSVDIPKSKLKISYETYLSEPTDNVVFVVSVWNYPGQIDMSKPEVNLQDGFNGMISALPGSETKSMKIQDFEGFKALEFLVQNENIFFQGKLILVHNTLYQVFTVYKNTEDMKNNFNHFINSFELIEPEKRKVETPPPPPAEEEEEEKKPEKGKEKGKDKGKEKKKKNKKDLDSDEEETKVKVKV